MMFNSRQIEQYTLASLALGVSGDLSCGLGRVSDRCCIVVTAGSMIKSLQEPYAVSLMIIN